MNSPVEELRMLASELHVFKISQAVLDDPRFPIWSGSSKPQQHHYGKGGLAQHTLEVVLLCLKNGEFFAKLGKYLDRRQIFLAGLFHDAGKMWNYRPMNEMCTEWEATPHKAMISHLVRSALLWNEVSADYAEYAQDWKDEILHAILAHHQLQEWGSPVTPHTYLAWLLHLCDNLSARMDDLGKK